MKTICILLLLAPGISLAQIQSKSQCLSTVRARSMSISSADAEKICNESSGDVVDCTVTKVQQGGQSGDAIKSCRQMWGVPTPPDELADEVAAKVKEKLEKEKAAEKAKGDFKEIVPAE